MCTTWHVLKSRSNATACEVVKGSAAKLSSLDYKRNFPRSENQDEPFVCSDVVSVRSISALIQARRN